VALPCPRLEINIKKRQKMSIPNIAKEDIINAFQFRHATKEFDATKMITDDDQIYFRNSPFITKFFWF
jgi:hypothetical protein